MSDKPYEKFKRNEYGLLEGVEYKFTPDGYIDWMAMIDRKTGLVPNRDRFKGKTPSEINALDPSQLNDSEVLILLGTLKKLGKIRGYNYVEFKPIRTDQHYVSMICEIEFIGNYETDRKPIKFQSTANASLDNVKGDFTKYLETLAENRSFARCIRNFLGINIVSKEEMVSTENENFEPRSPVVTVAPVITGADPLAVLKSKVGELNWSFDDFKNAIINANNKAREDNANKPGPKRKIIDGVEDWNSYSDIPKDIIFSLTDRINKYIEEIRKTKK